MGQQCESGERGRRHGGEIVRSRRRALFAILAARAARSFAYGALAVVLADALAARGIAPAALGALFTVALLTGAGTLAASGMLARRFGVRATVLAGGLAMALAGVLLAGPPAAVLVACLLGVVSPGGQDVGAFVALEQAVLAEERTGLTRRLAWYNLTGAAALALGALCTAVLPTTGVFWVYALAGIVAAAAGPMLPPIPTRPAEAPAQRTIRFGVPERLAALFALDAFAGGFVVQAFIAYWFTLRFGVGPAFLGPLLFAANVLAAGSYLLADPIAARIGLLRTMVFTHLPSNVLLCAIPFAPNVGTAAALLLGRFALSQMDVPTRQAFTVSLVPPHDRARAAGITTAVRPAAASLAPILSGAAFQLAALGVPFLLAGGLKVAYDLALLAVFRNAVPSPAEESDRA